MKWLYLAIAIPLLAGCSAEWHLKKAIKKNPALLSEPTVVTKWDTITMPPITIVDTLEIPVVGDSSVIENDSLQVVVKTVVDKDGNKKLSVSAKTKTIEVPHFVKVECPPQAKLLAIPWYYKVYKMSFFILILLLIVALARRISSRLV